MERATTPAASAETRDSESVSPRIDLQFFRLGRTHRDGPRVLAIDFKFVKLAIDDVKEDVNQPTARVCVGRLNWNSPHDVCRTTTNWTEPKTAVGIDI
jgi:hypothetical protein